MVMYKAPLSPEGAKLLNDPEGRRQLIEYVYNGGDRSKPHTITLSDGTKLTIAPKEKIAHSYHFNKSWWQQLKEWCVEKTNKKAQK